MEGGTPQKNPEVFDASYDDASLDFERRPVALRLEGSLAVETSRAFRTVI